MKRRLIFTNAITVFASLLLLLFLSCLIVSNINTKNAEDELHNYLNITTEIYTGDNAENTAALLHEANANLRVTIIDIDGNVKVDTSLESTESHLDRPEIVNLGTVAYRYSNTLGINMMYLASFDDGSYVRVSLPESSITVIVTNLMIYGSIGLMAIMGISILFIFGLTKNMFMPLKKQIGKLSTIVGEETEYDGDDIEVLSGQIDEVNHLINQKIDSLKNETEKVNFVLDSINQGLIVVDGHENVIMINSYAANIFKFDKEEILNKKYLYLIRDVEIQKQIQKAIENNALVSTDYKIDGRIYLFNFNSLKNNWSSYQNKNGVALLIIDVTDKRNIEVMKREFFANASHELKSPLTSIIGFQQMIKEGIITDDTEIKDATTRTIKEANRMNKIIVEMLELSKLESKEQKKIEPTELKPIIENIIESYQKELSDRNINVNLNIENLAVSMNALDADHLVRNLIDNAVKYNNIGGKIDITVSKKNRNLIVQDNGIGIALEHQSRIFERFYRVDSVKSKEAGGTGLGLAIVKHICMEYGFKIMVESELGTGSKFTIQF